MCAKKDTSTDIPPEPVSRDCRTQESALQSNRGQIEASFPKRKDAAQALEKFVRGAADPPQDSYSTNRPNSRNCHVGQCARTCQVGRRDRAFFGEEPCVQDCRT